VAAKPRELEGLGELDKALAYGQVGVGRRGHGVFRRRDVVVWGALRPSGEVSGALESGYKYPMGAARTSEAVESFYEQWRGCVCGGEIWQEQPRRSSGGGFSHPAQVIRRLSVERAFRPGHPT
jgi:hypothetical protein